MNIEWKRTWKKQNIPEKGRKGKYGEGEFRDGTGEYKKGEIQFTHFSGPRYENCLSSILFWHITEGRTDLKRRPQVVIYTSPADYELMKMECYFLLFSRLLKSRLNVRMMNISSEMITVRGRINPKSIPQMTLHPRPYPSPILHPRPSPQIHHQRDTWIEIILKISNTWYTT